MKVIRNFKVIFDYVELYFNRWIYFGLLVIIGYDFDGEWSEVLYLIGKKIICLIEEFNLLLNEGYSKGDIVVLCLFVLLEGNECE